MRRFLRTRRFAKGAVSFLCVGALVASQCVTAFAADWSYPVPTKATTVNKNLVTLGSQGDIWGEILGLSDVARNMSSDFNTEDGTVNADGVAKDVVVNLFGSDVNVNPNPYYANLIYNGHAAEKDQVDHYNFADKSGLTTGIDRGDTALVDAYGGVSATASYRPDIYLGNCAGSWQDPGSIVLRKDGETTVGVGTYETAISAAYDTQVSKIRSLKKGSEYYQTGDGSYNPYYVENLSMYGDVTDWANTTDSNADKKDTVGKATIASTYAQMYRLAEAAEGVLKSNSSKTTRYGDPMKIAVQYESYGRGLQDYVLSKIADKTVTKKKVAFVSSVDTSAKTVTVYLSSPSSSIQGTGGSFNGPYKAVEALENVTENIYGTWDPNDTSNRGSWATSKAITDLSSLKDADAIIITSTAGGGDKVESDLRSLLSESGISESNTPPVLSGYATSTTRGIPGFPMLRTDGLEMIGTEIGFVYPEIVNPVYALAYYYTQFYHVKSDTTTLSNVLSYNIENMSLPKGITADLSSYSDGIIDKAITEGLTYYASNKAAVDAATPKLTTSSYVELPSKSAAKTATIKAKSSVVKTFKAADLKKGAKSFTVSSAANVSVNSKAKLSYKKTSGSSKIAVSKTGKVTVKKATAKGTYKVKVKISAPAKGAYKATSKNIAVTVKVK